MSEFLNKLVEDLSAELRPTSQIHHKFRQDLIAKNLKDARLQNDIEISTMELTAEYYGKTPKKWEGLSDQCLTIDQGFRVPMLSNDDSKIFWQRAVEHLAADSKLIIPTQQSIEVLTSAVNFISQTDVDSYEQLKNHVNFFVFFCANNFKSASHPHYFGTLFIAQNNNVQELAISIIHELAHQELFLLNLVDRLVQTSSDFNLAHAPYQNKLRPPIGRLHSTHALYRMCQFEKKSNNPLYYRHRDIFLNSINSLKEDELTPFSWRIVNEVYSNWAFSNE